MICMHTSLSAAPVSLGVSDAATQAFDWSSVGETVAPTTNNVIGFVHVMTTTRIFSEIHSCTHVPIDPFHTQSGALRDTEQFLPLDCCRRLLHNRYLQKSCCIYTANYGFGC